MLSFPLFNNGFPRRKEEFIATLKNRVTEHEGHLRDRERALVVARKTFVNESQVLLGGGGFTG